MYTVEELKAMANKVVSCDPCNMICELQEIKAKSTSDRVAATIDTAIDVVVNNTVWED